MSLALSEVASRNAFTIVITDCLHKLDSSKIDIPLELITLQELTPLVAVLPFQLISLYIA